MAYAINYNVLCDTFHSKNVMFSTHHYRKAQDSPQLALLLKRGGNEFLNHSFRCENILAVFTLAV